MSFDGGVSWEPVTDYIKEKPKNGQKVFSWTLWRHDVPVWKLKEGQNEVLVRAIGSDGEI